MRITDPAIGGLAIAVAVALVWRFQPELEPYPSVAIDELTTVAPAERAAEPAAREMPTAASPSPLPPRAPQDRATDSRRSATPSPQGAPLPGHPPPTPMAELLAEREQEFPPQVAEGERQFAAEPVDATWAPGAQAEVLSKFAQMPGLTLIDLQVECRSTMCRLQLTQPSGAPDAAGARPFNILLDSIGYEPRWMMAIRDRSGALRSIAYLWRDGFAPQRLPAEAHEEN